MLRLIIWRSSVRLWKVALLSSIHSSNRRPCSWFRVGTGKREDLRCVCEYVSTFDTEDAPFHPAALVSLTSGLRRRGGYDGMQLSS